MKMDTRQLGEMPGVKGQDRSSQRKIGAFMTHDSGERGRCRLGRDAALRNGVLACVTLSAALPLGPALADHDTVLEAVTVTGTREERLLVETPTSVGVVGATTVEQDKPSHPAQVMSQVPGAAVAVTNGEGHTTAIRQPFTTSPVYLFLEDGIPSRSTGFFNHNALYEINVPQSAGIEVNRGPGSALYGSDAIGGVINVLTRTPPLEPELRGSLEAGEHGWRRALVSGGTGYSSGGWRADLNHTRTDGWRDSTAYERTSGTARWDHFIGDGTMFRTVLGFSEVDQETGANSPLVFEDFKHNPKRNYLPIAFRKVSALRLSTTYEREWEDSLLSVTPYFRDNSMDLLASFRLRFDPTIDRSENRSYGLMTKWRQNFAPMRARVIVGLDMEVSPGSRREDRINPVTRGAGAAQEFIAYTVGPRIYDYDVEFRGISPYVQGEFSPTERLRVTAGLRYDSIRFELENHLSPIPVPVATPQGARFYGQAEDTRVTFRRATPKLGATYDLGSDTHLFASYHQGFRAPSESQLFRPAIARTDAEARSLARSALELEAIKADQYEVGFRGLLAGVSYDVSVYELTKRDDIVSVRDPVTTQTITTNAGKTRHRGIEVGLGAPITHDFRVDVAFSYAKHEFVDWVTSQGNFSGKEQSTAPRVMSNARLTWSPSNAVRAQLEWVRLGSYWLDDANTAKYGGHDLLNLRGNYALTQSVSLFGSVQNLTDKRYADSAQLGVGSTPVFSPGFPRTLTAGIEARW